mgnify:CR=1 FL=1
MHAIDSHSRNMAPTRAGMHDGNPERSRDDALGTGSAAGTAMELKPMTEGVLDARARAEVKATLRFGDRVWLATEAGLCRRDPGEALQPAGALAQERVQALGPAQGGMIAVAHRDIVRLDGAGAVILSASADTGGLKGTQLGSDGRFGEILQVPA